MLPLSPAGRRYGAKRDQADYRDKLFFGGLITPETPDVSDLRQFCGPIKNQGDEGSCTGHTGAELQEWIDRKYRSEARIFSPQSLYVSELIMDGNFPEDAGSEPRTICRVLNQLGVNLLKDWPYVAGKIVKPSPEQIVLAAEHKLGGYHRLNGLPDLFLCLGDKTPWPVMLSLAVYESFESESVAANGQVPMPKETEQLMGYHEVLCVGYDKNKKTVICQNSWGEEWGDRGFFHLPFAYVSQQNLVSDLWVLHPGEWNKS